MSRIIIGIASGLTLVTIPPFLSQISPEKYHTVLGTLHQSSIGIGMLVAQSLSLLLAKPVLWRVELLVAAAIAVILLVIGLFIKDEVAEQDEGNVDERSALLPDEGQKKQPISVKELFSSSDKVLKSGCELPCPHSSGSS
jgi:MFS family permease